MVKLIQRIIRAWEVFRVIERKNVNLDTNVINVLQVNKTITFRVIFSIGNNFFYLYRKKYHLPYSRENNLLHSIF